MPTARIKLDNREIPVSGKLTIGRTSDNGASFSDDSNVSRYHAEIEERNGQFWLSDLGSSNGTQINGVDVTGPRRLADGDSVVLGGSARFSVLISEEPASETADKSPPAASSSAATAMEAAAVPAVPEPAAAVVANSRTLLFVAGGAVVVAAVVVVAVGAVYLLGGSTCNAKAVVNKPESGDTITAATEVEVDVENGSCVSRAVFTIDGTEFASATDLPFSATIDPKELPGLADGFDHSLSVRLEDENGRPVATSPAVLLAFESRAPAKPAVGTRGSQIGGQTASAAPAGAQVSLLEVQKMSQQLVKLFPASAQYSVSDKQFLKEVQNRTVEYAQAGFFERAAKYRDAINVAFVREQNLDAPLGFLLAMSRSKFVLDKQGSGDGLWKMNGDFAAANGYTGLCGTETLSDASQNCAAKASALYLKALVLGVFDGDVIYGVAAFGKSTQEAGVWKASLAANKADPWSAIKGAAEREQLVRLFAAGIVAENPQKFGLKNDRPLSELYRLAM